MTTHRTQHTKLDNIERALTLLHHDMQCEFHAIKEQLAMFDQSKQTAASDLAAAVAALGVGPPPSAP